MPIEYGDDCDEAAIRAADGTPRWPAQPLFGTEALVIDGAAVSSREPILWDLDRSIAALREHLGTERAHLCLPYGAGIDAIPELAEAAGFESVFWTRRQDRQANRPGDDPRRIVRRKCDFVRRLPGRGRRSLVGLLAHKVVRRLTSDPFI